MRAVEKQFFSWTILAVVLLTLGGCSDSDVTSSPEYGFAAFAGTRWKTKVKVAVAENHGKLFLLPPDRFDLADPAYVDTGAHVEAVFPAGAVVQIEHLMKDNGDWGGVYVTGTLDAGAYAGKSIVISERFFAPNYYVMPGFMKPGDPPNAWNVAQDMLGK